MTEELDWLEDIKTQFDFEYVDNMVKVKVIDRGCYYPTYLKIMVELNVGGAKEFHTKFGDAWHTHVPYTDIQEHGMNADELFLSKNGVNSCLPNNGDLCFLTPNNTKHHFSGDVLYKLIRISDFREFIISQDGFKKIDE